jgi:hypothetical protein
LPVMCNVNATILLGGETEYFCTSNIHDVRLPSSGMLPNVHCYLVTDVSGQPMVFNSKIQTVHSLYRLTLEDESDKLFRNVGK